MKTTIKAIAVTANILFFLNITAVTAILIFRLPLAESLMGAHFTAEDLRISPLLWYGVIKLGLFNLILSAAAFSKKLPNMAAAIGFWGTLLILALFTIIDPLINFGFTAYMTRVCSVSEISGMSITGSLVGMTSFFNAMSWTLIPVGWALIWSSSKYAQIKVEKE